MHCLEHQNCDRFHHHLMIIISLPLSLWTLVRLGWWTWGGHWGELAEGFRGLPLGIWGCAAKPGSQKYDILISVSPFYSLNIGERVICLTIKLAIASLKTSLSFESSPGSSRTLPTPCSTHQTISPKSLIKQSQQKNLIKQSHQKNLIKQSHQKISSNNFMRNSQKNLDWFSSPAGHNPAGGDWQNWIGPLPDKNDLVGLYQPLNDEDDGGKDEDWHQERWFRDEVEGNSDCSRDLHLGHSGRHLD